MKKIFFTILGTVLLLTACEKGQLTQIKQLPYRTVVEYTPGTYQIEVPGNVTPDALYPWVSISQNGNTVSYTVRRNTQDKIRRAEFSIEGTKDKLVISQKPHALDASLAGSLTQLDVDNGTATVDFTFKTSYPEDYTKWGVILSSTNKIEDGVKSEQGQPVVGGGNSVSYDNIEKGKSYFLWAYVNSTEGDEIQSSLVAIITTPVYVKAGENLQTAIDTAQMFQEIRVQGGATFGSIVFDDKNKNKSISGGWNADFTAQDSKNLSVIDAGGVDRAVIVAADKDFSAGIDGSVEISYFEIKNGKTSDKGGGIRVAGGPVYIHNCYIHSNESGDRGGGIATVGEIPTEVYIYNNIIEGNKCNGGHGGGISIETGNSDDNNPPYTFAQIVSNLVTDNISNKRDGYASSIYTAYAVDVQIVNNTIVGNMNWNEYGGPYPGFKIRDCGRIALVNNIVVGNLCSDCASETVPEEPSYYRQERHLDVSGAVAAVAYNIFEGNVGGLNKCLTETGNKYMPYKFSLTELISDTYQPTGAALGYGTLGSFNYASNGHPEDVQTCNVADLLSKYPLDLAGNPRVVGGKVDAGCYQAQ